MSVTGFNRRRREAAARLKAEQEQQAAQQKRARPKPKRKRKPKADPAGHNSADLAEAAGTPEPAEIDPPASSRATGEG